MHAQKYVAFLYINNELAQREMKKTVPFIIASKRIKYLRINLTKKVKDLYSENYKILMKEIKYNTNKWNDIHAHGLEELILFKMAIVPKAIYDTLQSPLKDQWHFSQN